MADIVITDTNVSAVAGASKEVGVAGVAIDAGKWVYIVASTGKLGLADADGSESSGAVGIAVNAAVAADQQVQYVTSGDVNVGSVLAVGTVYGISTTAGSMGLLSDRLSTDYVSVCGYGKTASVLTVSRINTGLQVP